MIDLFDLSPMMIDSVISDTWGGIERHQHFGCVQCSRSAPTCPVDRLDWFKMEPRRCTILSIDTAPAIELIELVICLMRHRFILGELIDST